MQNDKSLTKKALADSVERLANQFTDLNSRLNSISYDKVKQDAQLHKLDEDNTLVRQHLRKLQEQFNQLPADAGNLTAQWQKLRDQLASAESGCGSQAEQPVPEVNLERLEAEIALLQTDQQDQGTVLAEVRQYLNRLSNEIDDMRRETADITTHIRNLEETESELEVHDAEYKAKVYGLQGDVAELERKMSQAENPTSHSLRQPLEITDLHRQKIEQLEHQQTQDKGLYKELERRLLELANRIGETNARTQLADTRVDNQQERVALLQQSLEERIGELESVMVTLKELNDQREDQQIIDELKQRLGQIEQHVPSLEATIQKLQNSQLPKADIIPINERISRSEMSLTQQRDEIGGMNRQLDELTDKLAKQDQAVDRIDGLAEQLERLQGDGEESRTHANALEKQLHDYQERAVADKDTLNLRLTALLGEIDDSKDTQQQIKQQLTELESHWEKRQQVLDGLQAEQQRQIDASRENHQQRFVLLEQGIQTLENTQAELQSTQQQLTTQQTQQTEALEGFVDETSRHQATTDRLNLDLSQLQDKVDHIRSIDWRQTLAIFASFLLILLVGIGVHQLLQRELGDTERSLAQKIDQQGEIYVGHQELEQRLQTVVDSNNGARMIDPALLEEIQQTQQRLASRLTDVEGRLTATSAVDPMTKVAGPHLAQRLEKVEVQNQVVLERQQALDTTIEQLQQALIELRNDLQRRALPVNVQHWRDWAAARGYSIQLIGVSEKASLLAYAAQIGLDGERAILHTQREGADWYALLYGLYPTASDARQALDALPESLRRHQPWIRLLPEKGEFTPF